MSLMRVRVSIFPIIRTLLLWLSLTGVASCGAVNPPTGITSHVLVLVTDSQGNPVVGATVWVPADMPEQALEESGGLALTDGQGNVCADPPSLALFSACTDAGGVALLPCGDQGVYLVNYFKDEASGVTNAKCGDDGVVPAPFNP